MPLSAPRRTSSPKIGLTEFRAALISALVVISRATSPIRPIVRELEVTPSTTVSMSDRPCSSLSGQLVEQEADRVLAGGRVVED